MGVIRQKDGLVDDSISRMQFIGYMKKLIETMKSALILCKMKYIQSSSIEDKIRLWDHLQGTRSISPLIEDYLQTAVYQFVDEYFEFN